jgi:hypothetical protein
MLSIVPRELFGDMTVGDQDVFVYEPARAHPLVVRIASQFDASNGGDRLVEDWLGLEQSCLPDGDVAFVLELERRRAVLDGKDRGA